MDNPLILKNTNLTNEISKKCNEKGVSYKTLMKTVNGKESSMQRLHESIALLTGISRALGFNFFELYTDKAALQDKVKNLETELSALKQKTERIIIEHAVYKDTMEILKRHTTMPTVFDTNTEVKNDVEEA